MHAFFRGSLHRSLLVRLIIAASDRVLRLGCGNARGPGLPAANARGLLSSAPRALHLPPRAPYF